MPRPPKYPRPASAVPTAVDPDDEPSIPISVAEIQQSDTMPPPLREQLARVVAVGEGLWPLRRQIERIESNVAAIARSVTVHDTLLGELKPQLDMWRAATDDLRQQLPKLIGMVEGLTHHVRSIDARMRDLELEVRSLGERSSGHTDDIAAAQTGHQALAIRVVALETAHRDRAVESTASAKRDKWWIAGITALVGFAAGSLPTVIKFIRNHF